MLPEISAASSSACSTEPRARRSPATKVRKDSRLLLNSTRAFSAASRASAEGRNHPTTAIPSPTAAGSTKGTGKSSSTNTRPISDGASKPASAKVSLRAAS